MKNQFNEIVNLYSIVTKGVPINKMGPPFSYYYSDSINSNIISNDLIEIDIKAAFPTILNIILGDCSFTREMMRIQDKKARNIFIAISLKNGKENVSLYDLNLYCKIIILGYTYSCYENINILEYKKDGILICAVKKNLTNEILELFDGIQFHEKKINTYLRFNKTSIYQESEMLSYKGIYKSLPLYIKTIVEKFIIGGLIYDKNLLYEIKKIYSELYFQILLQNHIQDKIKEYYEFHNQNYLTSSGKLETKLKNSSPISYLQNIIYPILTLLRVKK